MGKSRTKDDTNFQMALLGLLSKVDKAIEDRNVSLEQKIQLATDMNNQLYKIIAQASMLGAKPEEIELAKKLATALDTKLGQILVKNKTLINELRGVVGEAKEELNRFRPR